MSSSTRYTFVVTPLPPPLIHSLQEQSIQKRKIRPFFLLFQLRGRLYMLQMLWHSIPHLVLVSNKKTISDWYQNGRTRKNTLSGANTARPLLRPSNEGPEHHSRWRWKSSWEAWAQHFFFFDDKSVRGLSEFPVDNTNPRIEPNTFASNVGFSIYLVSGGSWTRVLS